ncbi:uncharacterized protein LOC135497128 [Lineus longissimus]|uniref:uncharacterized protein LOC135497128 n=1 Tax=Lineus longissimus TaxID=88925 RepID=UPI00315DE4EA
MDFDKVQQFLLKQECNLEFRMNVPYASHHGGVWERQIRTIRSILSTILLKSGTQLDNESLQTYLYEVVAIINGRPLTTDDLEDPDSLMPLCPNQLLTMKSRVVIPPPGDFPREDLFLKKRWRRVQHLANEFWTKWRRDYLNNLQPRQKWNRKERDFVIGDVVIVKDDDLPRNQWKLAGINKVFVDEDQVVRTVRLAVGNRSLDNNGKPLQQTTYLERPIQKLVLLLESDPQKSVNQPKGPADQPE